MRKIRKLSLFVILGVVICALIFIGISSLEAQNKSSKGKPVKPPPEEEATWAVQLPAEGNTMLYGDGTGIYSGQEENIEVTVKKNMLSGPWKKDNDFITYIGFKISNSANNYRYVDFDLVSLIYVDPSQYDYVDPDIGYPCCVFPPSYDQQDICNICAYDSCMQDFMNGVGHPSEDYAFFSIDIHATDLDITNMGYHVPYKLGDFGHYHDYINMDINYQNQTADPTYHNIVCSKSAHKATEGRPFNIWITRTEENTWKIDVGTYEDIFFFFVEEYYYEQGEVYSTLYQGGEFYFTFDLIKNPQSSTPPAAPTNLYAGAPACDQIDLSWTDNSDNETGFEIERDSSFLNTVNANETSYSDTGVDPETTYSYRVRAFNDAGDSDYSYEASAATTTCGGTEPPDAPSDLTANARGKAKITLNWTDNSYNEDGFIIYRSFNGDDLIQYDTVGPNTSSYVDNQVSSKTTYNYQVCAYNSEGDSCSGTASARAK